MAIITGTELDDPNLTGTAADDTISGLGGRDHLYGGAGNDTLDGGAGDDAMHGDAGADIMFGGAGNDDYYVDNVNDVVSETTAPGVDDGGTNDRVYSTVSYTLSPFLERLVLLESALEWASDTVFGRLEYAQRSGDDLALEHEVTAPPGIATEVFDSGVLELGYLRRLATLGPVHVGLGVVGSLYVLDGGLRAFYGGQQLPVAGMVFLRIWPVEMRHSMPGVDHASMEHGM